MFEPLRPRARETLLGLIGDLERNGSLTGVDLLIRGWNGVASEDFIADREALLASGAISIRKDIKGELHLEIPDLEHARAVAAGLAGTKVSPEQGARSRRSALAECSSRAFSTDR